MTFPKVRIPTNPTGSVNRDLESKVFDLVSSKDFGGLSDGVTDDTAAINSAVAYLVTLGSGIVIIPPKTLYTEASLVLNSNVLLFDLSRPGTLNLLTKDEGSILPVLKGGIKIKSQNKNGVLLRADDGGIAGNPFLEVLNETTGALAGVLASFLDLTQGQNYAVLKEIVTPTPPGLDKCILFTKDNGVGKTQLCALFNTGAVQVVATQP